MAGKKPKFETPEEMARAVEAYFKSLEGPVLDKQGRAVLRPDGTPYTTQTRPATITGLAYHLGFASRSGFLNYRARAGFREIYDRAKLRCEAYQAERLFDREGVQGAKFSLQNNFTGWADRQAVDIDATAGFKIDVHVIDDEA